MVYERSVVFLIATLAMILSCFAFIADRSGNIPAVWNTTSSLETEDKVAHTSGMKTEVTGIDKVLQISDTKTSTEAVEQTSPDAIRERKFDFILENIENESNFPKITGDAKTNSVKENSVTDSVASAPRNVVLVIAETGQNQENFWKDFKSSHALPVEGQLQNCDNTDVNTAWFSLEGALVSGSRNKKCDCERLFGSNIVALLLWARDVKGMTTASLSNTNFTIPSLFEYEESAAIQRELNEPEENNMKLEIRKIKPEVHGEWHAIDIGKSIHRASPLVPPTNIREDDDTMWDVFDMFSKIRLALFRSLLESLGGNVPSQDDSSPSYNSYIRRPMLSNMIRKLKSVENDKGFILAITVPANELDSTIELLQREVPQETLLAVTGVCSRDAKSVPFFAQGPAATMLREAKIIWDLPMTIGHIIASGCHGSGCKIRRRDPLPLPVTQPNVAPHNVAILRRIYRDVATPTDKSSKPDTSASKKHEIREAVNLKPKAGAGKDNEDSEERIRARNSSPNFTKAEMFTTIFGTLVSIFTASTFAS